MKKLVYLTLLLSTFSASCGSNESSTGTTQKPEKDNTKIPPVAKDEKKLTPK